MAEAFIHFAVGTLTSLIKDEVGLALGVNKEMKKLASIFTTIQAVLEDAHLNHLESNEVQDWLVKLEDVAYDVDDVLDECATHVAKSKHFPRRYLWKKILIQHDLGKKMKEAVGRLEEIAAERAKFHLREIQFENSRRFVAHSMLVRETGSTLNEAEYILGRDDDKHKIVDMLVNQVKGDQRICVLPILGVGGLGKTTLAQLIFKDPHVGERFDLKMWVSVNDKFDPKFLIKAMIESGERVVLDSRQSMDSLQRRLGDLLKQKRYLLVLDDVWCYDQEKWCQLRNVLACGSVGSSIIVTTRLRRVAEIVGVLPIYELEGLSNEHCLTLLKHRAFQCVEEELKYPNLEVIGKQIVKKCAGVPLAAKTLGGLLRFKRKEAEWIHVKESEIWNLREEGNMILPVLKLSYHHLPLELRQCFAYCGTFDKNFKESKDKLIYLWMAHGYISSNGNLEVEEVGEQILDELIARSLLHIKKDDFLKMVYITIHDLVHDLTQSLIKNKVLGTRLGNLSTTASNRKIRQVNRQTREYPNISSITKKYKCLRVLDLKLPKTSVLPFKLSSLKHLRFLNLSGSAIESLPDSICNIWNLQVLILNWCNKLVVFPKKMRNLKNLRHLIFDYCDSLCDTPYRIRELRSLRSLSKFIVGHEVGHRIDELECLNLGGKLKIVNLERVASVMDVKKANLVQKQNLHELQLVWENTDVVNLGEEKDEKILEALQLPPNVEDLTVKGFSGRHFPNWMEMLSLEKLMEITISDCKNLFDCSHLEKLPHLKVLHLTGGIIQYLVGSANGVGTCFPALEDMWLSDLINLKGFSNEEGGQYVCPMLRMLNVLRCPSLILPPLNKLEKLYCNDGLNVASLPVLSNLKTLDASIGDECIPVQRFPNLNALGVSGAHDKCLATNWMHGLNSFHTLRIWGGSLTCLPKEWFCDNNTLQGIHIRECNEFITIAEEIKHLHSLRILSFNSLPKMVSIPDAVKHLAWMKELRLTFLDQLASLPDWLGDLTSLTSLRIEACDKLASLPDSIKGMTNLESLSITGCPDLSRVCEEGKGEEWHKIAHIPKVTIADAGW